MIDITKLRKLLDEDGKNNIDLGGIYELIDRLEAVEKELVELRLGISKQQLLTDAAQQLAQAAQRRADKLKTRWEEAEKERDNIAQQLVQSEQGRRKAVVERDVLRDRLALEMVENEAMEKQEPVAIAKWATGSRVEIVSGPSMYVGKTGTLGTAQPHHAKPGYVLVNLDHGAGSVLLPKAACRHCEAGDILCLAPVQMEK